MERFRETVSALPAGRAFVRAAIAVAVARSMGVDALTYASQRWPNDSPATLDHLQKSPVSAGTTDDSNFAAPLIYPTFAAREFAQLVEKGSIIGRLTGARRLPFNVAYPAQTTATTPSVAWMGSGQAAPVGKASLTSNTLAVMRVGGMLVVTNELLRHGSPESENIIQAMMTRAAIEFLDQQFIDPGVAAVANVSPASVLNGTANVRQATGSTAITLAADLASVAGTAADNNALGNPYWVMTRATAVRIACLRDTAGGTAFPTVTAAGGTLLGISVIVSNVVPSSTSAGSIIALVDAAQVDVALGAFDVAASDQAAVQMDNAPTQDSGTPTATQLVSMFQTNSSAIRLSCDANWQVVRSGVTGYVDNLHL